MFNTIKSIYGSTKSAKLERARAIAQANRSIYGNSNVDKRNRESYLDMVYSNIK